MENVYTLELYHHGVKGMRWGVRRYQNRDGSLTPRGKKRYIAEDGSFTEAGKKKFTKKDGSLNRRGKKLEDNTPIEEKKDRILKSRSAKKLYENADLFTTQELQAAYTRLQLEKNIANLSPKEKSKVDKIIGVGKKVSDFVDTGSKVYNNVAKVYNALSEDGRKNPWPIIGSNDNKDKKDKKDKKDD